MSGRPWTNLAPWLLAAATAVLAAIIGNRLPGGFVVVVAVLFVLAGVAYVRQTEKARATSAFLSGRHKSSTVEDNYSAADVFHIGDSKSSVYRGNTHLPRRKRKG
jgi:hypothetical protein